MITSPNDTILVETRDAICTITFNRPDFLNAINPDLAAALLAITKDLQADTGVRAVVLKGTGDHFMAGGDVKGFKRQLDAAPDRSVVQKDFERMIGDVHEMILAMRAMPQPIIASVKGAVAGAGVSLMLACDMVLTADDAFFTLAYCHLGTSPDGGSTWFLPRTVGQKRAFEIALLGDRFDAPTALAMGLINRVVPAADLDAETEKLAARLAAGPSGAYAETKALLNASMERSLADQLDAETRSFVTCVGGGDFFEGVTAFVEKRKPAFTGN